jgi:putative ABC transport system substrate-binding protein
MRRRDLVGALAALPPLWAGPARAQQQQRRPRVGVLCPFSPGAAEAWHAALEQGLAKRGWRPGDTVDLDYRFAEGNTARLAVLADELLRDGVDLLVTEVTEATVVAKEATRTVPIVMVAVGDPVAANVVASLAHPGGNVTGLSQNIVESVGKRLELLVSVVEPGTREVLVIWNPDEENSILNWRELNASSARIGVKLVSLETRGQQELEKVLAAPAATGMRALYVVPGPLFVTNLHRIAAFARDARLASVFHLPEYVRLGGLLSYGPDRFDLFRRAAGYIDRILHGARPADLPVEQPVKYELSINTATARAIGLRLTPLILAQADETVE